MSIYENADYEVKELSFDEMMHIIDMQKKTKKICYEKKIAGQSILQKIKAEANAELAPWLTANR